MCMQVQATDIRKERILNMYLLGGKIEFTLAEKWHSS